MRPHIIFLLVTSSTTRLSAQFDPMEALSPHYGSDSAYYSVDTIPFSIPLADAKPRIVKLFTSSSSAWTKTDVRDRGHLLTGGMEFLYAPDNLGDATRMGYLEALAKITWEEGRCIVRLDMWIQRQAVTSLPNRSFGPISKGDRCSLSMCSALGVAACTELCNTELWPVIRQVRYDIKEQLKKFLDY